VEKLTFFIFDFYFFIYNKKHISNMALDLLRKDPWNGDFITGITYYGYAMAGTQDNEPLWSIRRKVVINGILRYEYPYITGSTLANTYPAISVNNIKYIRVSGLIWDNRANYTYAEANGVFSSGIWDDSKIWIDIEQWKDYP